jgi:uncharacterized membrane protein
MTAATTIPPILISLVELILLVVSLVRRGSAVWVWGMGAPQISFLAHHRDLESFHVNKEDHRLEKLYRRTETKGHPHRP